MFPQAFPLFVVVEGERSVRLVVGWDDEWQPIVVELNASNYQHARSVHRSSFHVFVLTSEAEAFAKRQKS